MEKKSILKSFLDFTGSRSSEAKIPSCLLIPVGDLNAVFLRLFIESSGQTDNEECSSLDSKSLNSIPVS